MIFKSKYFFIIATIIYFSLACKHPEKTSAQPETNQKTQSSSGAASNEAKITATIMSIDNTRDSSDTKSPCYKAPCYANIRIEKIERKGSLFQSPENLSDEIRVYFIFTLYSTNEDLFPNMGVWYPGLKINDKFEAIIQSRIGLNNQVNYIIYEYKK